MENNLEQLHVSNCDFHYSVLFSVYINCKKKIDLNICKADEESSISYIVI